MAAYTKFTNVETTLLKVNGTDYNTRVAAIEADVSTAEGKITALEANRQNIIEGKVPATNLLTNGDFSNGTTGWSTSTLASCTVSGNVATCLANENNDSINRVLTSVVGHKYYFAAQVKALSSLIGFYMSTSNKFHSGGGNYELLSSIFTATSTNHGMGVMDTRASGFDNFYVKYAIAIDLTATFGAGNEPTAAGMDALLSAFPHSWFDGTQELVPFEKALKYIKVGSVIFAELTSGTAKALALANVPAGSMITQVICQVTDAFNSGSGDTIAVGISGTANKFLATTDITATTVGAYTKAVAYQNDSALTVYATWTGTGTAPDAGGFEVYVAYFKL